jgi:peptide/nickel transport system substrate-binding protein
VGLRRLARIAAPIALVIACAACTSAAGSASGSSTTTTINNTLVLQKGGTVTVAVPYLPSEFNPAAPSGNNPITEMVMQQVWPQFFVSSSAQTVQPNPGLLVSAEVVSVNPQTIVYVLNSRATWSDGVPIRAADFIYNWHEQVQNAPNAPATAPVAGYRDIAAIRSSNGGRTVTVRFAKPYADWEALFNFLVPAHIASLRGWSGAFGRFDPNAVVSGGPFMFSSEIPGRELVLVRNPTYAGPLARLDRIVFRVEKGAAATLRALERGEVDIAELSPDPSEQAILNADLHLRTSTNPSALLWQLDFNLADPLLGELALRQAISAAIDRRQLISNTIGLATPYSAIVDNRLYWYGAPGGRGNAGSYDEPDLAEAAALFTSAGFSIDSSGHLLDAAHRRVVLDLVGIAGDPLVVAMEQQLQAQLLEVGIELRVTNEPLRTFLGVTLPTGGYELALAPYRASLFPSTTATLYSQPVGPQPTPSASGPLGVSGASAQLIVPTDSEPGAIQSGSVTRDVMGFDDPRVDALFAAASTDLNASSRANLYNEIDTELWATLPTLPLFQQPRTLVVRKDIRNVSDSQTWSGPMWNAQNWAIQLNPPPYATTTTVP